MKTIEEVLKENSDVRLTCGSQWLLWSGSDWEVWQRRKYQKYSHHICSTKDIEVALAAFTYGEGD